MNGVARLFLFLSSYAPLALIYAAEYWGRQWSIVWAACFAVFLSVFAVWFLLSRAAKSNAANPDIVQDHSQPGGEVMGYVASYIAPFLFLPLSDVRQLVMLSIYLSVLGYLYVTTDMVAINPALHVLLGYRVYSVRLKQRGAQRLITRHKLHLGDAIWVARIGPDLLIEGKKP